MLATPYRWFTNSQHSNQMQAFRLPFIQFPVLVQDRGKGAPCSGNSRALHWPNSTHSLPGGFPVLEEENSSQATVQVDIQWRSREPY